MCKYKTCCFNYVCALHCAARLAIFERFFNETDTFYSSFCKCELNLIFLDQLKKLIEDLTDNYQLAVLIWLLCAGHVDFYPNGGRAQRGCQNLLIGGLYDFIYCQYTQYMYQYTIIYFTVQCLLTDYWLFLQLDISISFSQPCPKNGMQVI